MVPAITLGTFKLTRPTAWCAIAWGNAFGRSGTIGMALSRVLGKPEESAGGIAQDYVSVGVLANFGRTELSGLLGVGIGSVAGETDRPE